MDSISTESPMQVDEPDYHANPCECILESPNLPSMLARFNIADEYIKDMYEILEALIHTDYDDATIRRRLRNVHLIFVYSHDIEVIECLADRNEFVANVEREGEKKVVELLRDTAKRGSWSNLFKSRTCSTLLT
jgi:hypothetical protein